MSLATPVNVPLSQVPIELMPATATTEIKIAIRAYSIAVAPEMSRDNAEKSVRIRRIPPLVIDP